MEKNQDRVILKTNKISKHFGGLKAVDGISFELKYKDILALIGPNGAGKTTTFNLISGVLPLTSGEIFFKDENISEMKTFKRCKMGIGRTFQIMQLFEDMSVLDNITTGAIFGHSNADLKLAKKRAEEICERLNLNEYKDYESEELPLAHRKRLEIARAYATNPEVLLLDEIMEGLNVVEAKEMIDLVKSIRDEGISIIMIDHVMHTVKELADWVIVMNYGQLLTQGTYNDVVNSPEVIEAYLGKEEDE
jgi:branched-chain amino acid transport system ATP-binding protein